MAESPAHRFGQIVGNFLEELIFPVLLKFCDDGKLYLDRHGDRAGVRKGRKVSWEDKYGNVHDLDFVIEKGGSPQARGRPVAFVEAAWRRYTKHSRNKAQEIQGAVLPIAEKYATDHPFLGAVLAGVFTRGSLDQLRSVGFEVIYLPYESIIAAFASAGIDARFDESTPDREFAKCVAAIDALSEARRQAIKTHLLRANRQEFDDFFAKLRLKLDRLIERVIVLPLFGTSETFTTTTEAWKFIDSFNVDYAAGAFQKYEVIVVYTNTDEIRGIFTSKERTKEFLTYVAA